MQSRIIEFNLTKLGGRFDLYGQRIGYVRVSSFDQNPERQLEQVGVDKLFTDKVSGKDTKRPELDALLAFVREGDTVVVHSMDRLARNLDDLRRMVQTLTKRGVCIEFVKEKPPTFTGEDSSLAKLMLSVMGAFAEFERALVRERQREGIALAKQRGVYRDISDRSQTLKSPKYGSALRLATRKRRSLATSASAVKRSINTFARSTNVAGVTDFMDVQLRELARLYDWLNRLNRPFNPLIEACLAGIVPIDVLTAVCLVRWRGEVHELTGYAEQVTVSNYQRWIQVNARR